MKHSWEGTILLLVPDLEGASGGIARHARFLRAALRRRGGMTLLTVALHDTEPADKASDGVYIPCGGSRVRFAITSVRLLLTKRPALVIIEHCHLGPVVAWLCRLLRIPYVQIIHGIEVWEPLTPARLWALNRASLVLSVSRYSMRRAQAVNPLRLSRHAVLYNCLDPALAGVVTQPRRSRHMLLSVARLTAEDSYKGIDIVLKALPAIRAQVPGVRYHVLGDGNARAELVHLAARLGVADCVVFEGRVPDDVLAERYACAELFVLPSRLEGFGLVFLEAMAHGTPAIGGNEDATPEVIRHAVTGYVLDPRSPTEVADAVVRLLRDDDLRERMGSAARQRALTEFSFDTFTERLWELLTPLLDSSGGAS